MRSYPIKLYALVGWTPSDIQEIKPLWGIKKCQRFLDKNQNKISEQITRIGWEVIADIIKTA